MPRAKVNRSRTDVIASKIGDAHKRRYGERPDRVTWAGRTDAFTPLGDKQVHWIVDPAGPRFVKFNGEL